MLAEDDLVFLILLSASSLCSLHPVYGVPGIEPRASCMLVLYQMSHLASSDSGF